MSDNVKVKRLPIEYMQSGMAHSSPRIVYDFLPNAGPAFQLGRLLQTAVTSLKVSVGQLFTLLAYLVDTDLVEEERKGPYRLYREAFLKAVGDDPFTPQELTLLEAGKMLQSIALSALTKLDLMDHPEAYRVAMALLEDGHRAIKESVSRAPGIAAPIWLTYRKS